MFSPSTCKEGDASPRRSCLIRVGFERVGAPGGHFLIRFLPVDIGVAAAAEPKRVALLHHRLQPRCRRFAPIASE